MADNLLDVLDPSSKLLQIKEVKKKRFNQRQPERQVVDAGGNGQEVKSGRQYFAPIKSERKIFDARDEHFFRPMRLVRKAACTKCQEHSCSPKRLGSVKRDSLGSFEGELSVENIV